MVGGDGIEVRGAVAGREAAALTPAALAFLARLERAGRAERFEFLILPAYERLGA